MRNEFTAIFELDDSGDEPRYLAGCIEVPEAKAEGTTIDEARKKLATSIKSGLELRRKKTLRHLLINQRQDATQEVIAIQETISLY